MKNSPKRFKFSLGKLFVLLLFFFVLLSRWISPLHQNTDGFVHWIFRPFLSVSNILWRPLENTVGHYFFLLGLQDENRILKAENADLKQKWLESQNQVQAYNHFQNTLSVWQKTAYHPKLAQVLSYDPLDPSAGIWINQGHEDSIAPGQVVVAGEGVVGVVSKVLSHTSKVIPLISSQSAVDVELIPSGPRGILKGVQKNLELDRRYWLTKMEYMGSAEKIEVGDVVSTSGLDKIFPRALLIGKVSSVKKDERGLFSSAEVLPEVDFSTLREVAILIP